MKRACTLLTILLLLSGSISFSQTIAIDILAPLQNRIQADSILSIRVVSASTLYDLTGVTAAVAGRETPLVFTPPSTYTGTINLAGLPENSTQVLQIIATAGQFEQARDSVTFTYAYDPPPVLVVDSLLDGANANPHLRIRAAAVDNNTPSIKMIVYPAPGFSVSYPPQQFANPLDSVIDLSFAEGGNRIIVFIATDGSGKTARDTVMITVESSPHLQRLFTAPGNIVDFNNNKVLSNLGGTEYLSDLTTGETVVVPFPRRIVATPGYSFITPYGVIFKEANYDTLWDWNNGSFHGLGGHRPRGYLFEYIKVIGSKAMWSIVAPPYPLSEDADLLYLRDLRTRTDKLIAQTHNLGADLTVDGRMAFTGAGGLRRYRNNEVGNLGIFSPDGYPRKHYGPYTDGLNIIFSSSWPESGGDTRAGINLWDGLYMTELSSFYDPYPYASTPRPLTDYQLCGGWMSYVKRTLPEKISQIWLRDSAGITNTQRTFFNTSSTLDLLNPSGDLIAVRNNRRFLHLNGSLSTRELASTLGKTYYRDSTWYITTGRHLYKVNVNILPDTVANSTIVVVKDSVYQFKLADFESNFKGPATLMKIRIDSLPVNGTLKLNNVPIVAGTEIKRLDLNKLTYTTNPRDAFVDSIVWNGSNGTDYTAGNAVLKINIITPFYSVSDGAWSTPATWENNTIPPAEANIIIKTAVIADVDVTCNSLQVIPPGSLTVNSGVTVTVIK